MHANLTKARVAKLADAPDLGSGGEILRGSSPLPGTSKEQTSDIDRSGITGRSGSDVGCWMLEHAPFQLARVPFGLPQTRPAEKCILILSSFNTFRQRIETMGVSAAQDDVIGNERPLQLLHRMNDFAFPFFFAKQLQAWDAKIIFNDAAVVIRQVAELERQ